MFGPLPVVHRVVVSVSALLACVGVGAWLGHTLPAPMVVSTGVVLGALLGLAVTALALHGSSPHQPRAQRVPVHSRRHR